jgi:ribonucleoside-diphosphate reductase alpha chain
MTDDTDDTPEPVQLPTKTINPDDDLDDRLTSNVTAQIGPSRYFAKDDSGTPVEDWGGVFERVAQNVAIAEAVFHDVPISLTPDELSEWVDEDTLSEFFGDSDYHELDEDIAPYVEYDALAERLEDAPRDIHERTVETKDEFESMMREQRFMPNSPTLMNAGRELQQLSACFVISPGDAMIGDAPDGRASIMSAAEQAAGVFKSGGGVGYPFHLLRPKGARIASTDGVSSGPLSFMEIFDTTCGTVEQGGCVATNERVMTEEGYKRLGDIHDGLALSTAHTDARVRTRDGLDDVITSSDSGELPSVRVETEHGYELTVTPNHELLVLRSGELEFVEAGELDNTDTLVLDQSDKTVPVVADLAPPDEQEAYHHNAQTVPVENYPDTLTPDMAWVLGALWGDGTTRLDENEVVFSLGHDEQVAIDRVVGFFTDLGLDVSTYDRSGSGKGDYTHVQVRSAQLADWFDRNGFTKGALDELPEALYQSPDVFTDFLGGLTVDATIKESGTVSYSTADESFATTVQDLLLAVGIPSKLATVGARSDRYSDDASYRVRVTPGAGATRFFETVDHRFETTPETSSGERQNQVTDASVVERILDEHFEKNKMLADGGDRSSMKELRRYERGDRTPSLRRLRSLLGDVGVDPDTYEVLEESNLFVPVDGVVDVGPQAVCDIENKSGQPEFIASNVVVHNKRRGAQMGIMHVQHPDIGRFCVSKRGEDTLTNFNISAGISDEFREAVKKDETVRFIDPETGFPNPDTFEVVPETAHFYDPEFADSWNDDFDKPGVGYDGKQVEENFWRDYLEYMADPEAFEEYRDEISLEPGEPMELPAGFIWQLMVDGAYNNGEPGFVYLDEINEHHSVDVEENPSDIIHATNPCAEQPLSNYEACNLGHVNLSLMVDEGAEPFDQWLEGRLPDFEEFVDGEHVRDYLEHALDTEQLAMTARNGARFLDNVVTMSKFPLEEIEEVVHNQRKIGLGLMGFHQMLLQMGIEYGSSRSYKVAREIMRLIDEHATEESRLLADERGVYGNWADSKYADPEQYPDWIEQHAHVDPEDVDGPIEIRNHKQTTIAPTGTTSMIGNTTGGCEPLYNVAYFKNVGDDIQGDEMLVEFDDYFLDTLEANGISPDAVREEATELMMNNDFDGVDDLDTVPDNIARLFVTTEDLSVEQHIRVQAAFQEYCSSSISKTLNMANDVGLDDVSDAIDLALQLGIKGATIYRVNSRSEEVKTTSVTGGGVTVPEADADTLVDEVTGRLDADELDDETREALVDALGVEDERTSVATDDAPVSLSQD